jgi:hypothetical protein
MPKFIIIYADDGSPCHWQLQHSVWLFFWRNSCGNVSSATTAAHEMMIQMKLPGWSRGSVIPNITKAPEGK